MPDCTYCGAFHGADKDHVISAASSGIRKRDGEKLVPACKECNTLLGSLYLNTVEARAAYLAGRLQARYKKLLASPEWDQDELEELGYALRTDIERSLAEKVEVMRRIEHLRLRAETPYGE